MAALCFLLAEKFIDPQRVHPNRMKFLQDRHGIEKRAGAPGQEQWCRHHQALPTLFLLTNLCQFLELKAIRASHTHRRDLEHMQG